MKFCQTGSSRVATGGFESKLSPVRVIIDPSLLSPAFADPIVVVWDTECRAMWMRAMWTAGPLELSIYTDRNRKGRTHSFDGRRIRQ